MKRIFLAIILACSLSVFAQHTQTLRLMTYNLRFGELASLEELAAYIKQYNPDVVAVQELDSKTTRIRAPKQNGKDFIGELAYHTGLFGIYGKAIDYSDGYYGIGILSKYPFISSERILLPNPTPLSEGRAVLISEIELAGDRKIVFACTHLDLKAEKRAVQMKAIKKQMKKYDGLKFLAGDFNTTPEEGEVVKALKNWTDLLPADLTCPTNNPKVKIDYILYENSPKIKLINSFVDHSAKLSDHLPGIADIEITF